MSFLDNFAWAFQEILLISKNYKEGKYGEKIQDGESYLDFKGIIQEKGNFGEFAFDTNKNLQFTSKDFEMRSPVQIKPKKGDNVQYNGNEYTVIYSEAVMVYGKIDHYLSIIRLIN